MPNPNAQERASTRKKRIPTACGSCRQSKVKCDGQRPCSQCRNLGKTCTFVERPKEPNELKIEALEREIESLKSQLDFQNQQLSSDVLISSLSNDDQISLPLQPNIPNQSPIGLSGALIRDSLPGESSATSYEPRKKRRMTQFEVGTKLPPDFITAGLINLDQAKMYFDTFFQGCDTFVPVFDPTYDTFNSLLERSGLLLNTICTIGCRVAIGTDSHEWRRLNFHNSRMFNAVVTNPQAASLETVQALLVRACFVPERSLLVSIASRMAFDLGFPDACEELTSRFVSEQWESDSSALENGVDLMRKARTWLHIYVLGQILHVDAGDLSSFQFRGNVRRCRVILDSPFCRDWDMLLLPQVELNVLRTHIYDSFSGFQSLDDEELQDVVRDATVDIEVWYADWMRILEQSRSRMPIISLHLTIQKFWSKTMAVCCAVRASGVENIDAMTPVQRSILETAKKSLRKHLETIIGMPMLYLHKLRYATDFVWAKCAFSYLLLLKLALLFPDVNEQMDKDLISQGYKLLSELNVAVPDRAGINTERVYLQLIQTGIDKFNRAIQIHPVNDTLASTEGSAQDKSLDGHGEGQNELESFVPEQFVFEWDFPGLNLFSSPTTDAGFLDSLLVGALDAGDFFHGRGWPAVDLGG